MSHFVKCDRCAIEDSVMGSISLPPGWQKICSADLCESCCHLVHDFIRFTPERAASLPVEPIPQTETTAAPADKLFETAPESSQVDSVTNLPMSTEKRGPVASLNGESFDTREISLSSGTNSAGEASTEERARTRKAKHRGQDAILPDNRKPQPGAPA